MSRLDFTVRTTDSDFALQIPADRADGRHGRRSHLPSGGGLGRLRMHATQVVSSSMPARTRTAFRE